VRSAAWSPDGRFLASGSEDGAVRIWDAETGALLRTLAGHTDWVLSAAWSPDGRFLASASSDGTVRIWGVPGG
jgi:WD40 repeat protein